jgi:hypothetical protein
MPNPIDFHFDFSSPYSFLASEQIEPLSARHLLPGPGLAASEITTSSTSVR